MPSSDLSSHTCAYLTVGELAQYLHVSRRQILKQIQAGALEAVRLGPRAYRIHVNAARDFERRSLVHAQAVPARAARTPIARAIRDGHGPTLGHTAWTASGSALLQPG
jgi:excisionase family DNA binding protein